MKRTLDEMGLLGRRDVHLDGHHGEAWGAALANHAEIYEWRFQPRLHHGLDIVVQLDEPVLTELAFSPGNTRTFMCAALAARRDPAEELALAVSLINRVVEDMPVRIGVHVCRGNWSRDESTLLRGSYAALAPHLERINAAQLVLEYATARAGEILAFGSKEIGLGVVNPRTDTVETPEEICVAVERARALYPDDRIFLNPDCGFGTFSRRPMNSEAIALAKIGSMVSAARMLRQA